MAVSAAVNVSDMSSLDRQWIKKSLELQLKALQRSRSNEIVGSDIYNLRTKEMDALSALILRF